MSDLNYRDAREVWLDAAQEILDPPKGVALPWWPKFTEYTGGLLPHQSTLICAPTGAGKTQLLACLSAQFLQQGVPHFVAPVETGDVDYMARVASTLVKRDLNCGERVPVEVFEEATKRIIEAMEKAPMNVATYDNRVAIEEMMTMLAYQHQTYGVKVALLDNLNFFLNVVSSQMEKAEMDSAIHEIVMLAKKLPIHVILIVHPKKTERGRVESEFDIKGSSTAVQEASNVLLFNRPREEEVEAGSRHFTDRELVFRKLRKRGFNVGKPIWFAYQGGRLGEVK
jgi:tRNA splicing endonuclease